MDDYYEREFLRIMYRKIGCMPILLLCVALFFLGCATTRETEFVAIHDTLTVHHSDTVREYKLKTLYDTVHQFTERLVTMDADGNVVREVNNHYYHEKVVEKDSVNIYKALLDSIKQSLNINHEKETVVEKKPSFWEQFKWRLISCALLVALVLALLPTVKGIILRLFRTARQQ